jgi:hypothetical protein
VQDVGSVVIPIAVILIIFAAITGIFIAYFRYERHRTERLAIELERFRVASEASAAAQREVKDQLGELTGRVAAVEELLRSVG